MAAKKVETKARTEQFESVRPNGARVLVTRDLDTGEQTVEEIEPAPDEQAEADEQAEVEDK